MKFISPAKVNLFFRLLHKRKDGYHEIYSLFQAIDLCDELWIEKSDSDFFSCDHSTLSMDSSNLVCKAIELFRAKTRFSFPVRCHLVKKIPIGAGLGGGSSNAATVLFALNQLSGNSISVSLLQEWAKSLGADVPFFFSTGSALCRGFGDLVESIKIPEFEFWLAYPFIHIETKEVFNRFNFFCPSDTAENALALFKQGIFEGFNDLEEAAFQVNPLLVQVKQSLKEMGFKNPFMTGSGSAFIGQKEGTPQHENIQFYKVRSLQREKDKWYG